jgi:predicted RNA-binding Zn ribbon-like protein
VEESLQPASAGPFELSGGALCLDFANTWGDRGRPETDQLADYRALLAFARQTGGADAATAARLARHAAAQPTAAAVALAGARGLRETLARLFAAKARGRATAAADVARFNAALAEALPHLRLAARGGGFAWTWDARTDDLLAPLWPVLRSAAELLASDDLARVRQCDGAACTWLFLDNSRNRSRRWCSMASCGNRAKARRHYRRSRGE